MSCIRFNTPEQLQSLRDHIPTMLTAEEVARRHPAPPVTESKIRRLRLLAADANPRIRESVASSYHAPSDVFAQLAADTDADVRCHVARNEAVPPSVLRTLLHDESEHVRGWLALNRSTPAEIADALAGDASETVQALLRWKRSFEDTAPAGVA